MFLLFFTVTFCVSLLFVGFIAGSVPLCNIDDGEDTDFVAVSEKAKLMMGKRKEISFNLERGIGLQLSSEVNPSELSDTQQLGDELMDQWCLIRLIYYAMHG